MLSRSSLRALRLPVASTSRLTRQIALQSAHHPTASAPPLDHAPVDTTTHPQFHPSDSRKALEKVVLPPPAVWAHSTPHLDYALHHPVYTPAEVNSIEVVAHSRDTTTDKVASGLVGMARWGFDFVTRYKHASPEEAAAAIKREGKEGLSIQELTDQGYIMSKAQWMARILFLESVAGVPGMVGGMCRHLSSLRLMKRDGGWINTLLQEAENERMHLMTFLAIKQPSKFFRFMVLGAQGIFFNLFFAAYLVSPSATHRFVGFLEEQAVITYTQIASEIRLGHIPSWSDGTQKVPQIAKDYWRLGDSATMLDLILAVRADEAGHRFMNHTLADLGEKDLNPFGLRHAPVELQGKLPGFTREQSLKWSKMVEKDMKGKGAAGIDGQKSH